MSTATRPVPRFRVGDWASFEFGASRVWAQIIEYRGPLGVDGRPIYRIRFESDSGEDVMFEMPEEELTPALPDREAVIAYLKDGGLLALLRLNLGGGPNPPRAWLAFDRQGRLFPTLEASTGTIGGGAIPFFALQGYRIFAPKAEDVMTYLSGFGLGRDEAEEVVRAVGTTP